MSEKPSSVIVVGSYVQDHVWLTDSFPKPGETRRALGFSTGPGGKGFNQAIACVRQAGDVLFMGAVGSDALGHGAREYASREGLACKWLVIDEVPTATAGIVVNAEGANQIMVNLAANEKLTIDFLQSNASQFADARVLLVQLENNLDAVRGALELGGRHGLLRMLNPAPMHAGVDASLLAECDVITPNETEFAQLLQHIAGKPLPPAEVAAKADRELNECCRRLGVATCLITLGASGCFVSHAPDNLRGDSEPFYRLPAEVVHAVDTTGAGDAFNGALAAALGRATKGSFREAVVEANRVAALSTEKPGAAQAIPFRAEVIERFGGTTG
ncbi:ribokinase [Dokdonella sp.]|uniref:ribokinase n=1 Tax=Dokdonella sp. TaxID=2291710 RepID=UPI0035288B3D